MLYLLKKEDFLISDNGFPYSQNLFWDADINTIDLKKHATYIIERVITRGLLKDFGKLITYYSKEEIILALKKSKSLDPKSRKFCSWYFNIPLNELHVATFYS